jgi:hypothetical protein
MSLQMTTQLVKEAMLTENLEARSCQSPSGALRLPA